MSHFPVRSVSDSVQTTAGYAAFSGTVELGVGARGAVPSPTTYTTSSFTVPTALGGATTIPVAATTSFLIGDFLQVGTRASIMTSPAVPGSGAGSVSLQGRYVQGYKGGTANGGTGWYLISPNGSYTTSTSTAWNYPVIYGSAQSIGVADRSQIAASSPIIFSCYAGVYRIDSFPTPTSMVVTLVASGDIPFGGVCTVDTSASSPGTAVAQFYPLGIVPKGFIFAPINCNLTTLTSSAGTGTTNISMGWIPNYYGVNPTTRFGEWINNTSVQSGTTLLPNKSISLSIQGGATYRLAAISGMAFGIRVNSPGPSPAATLTMLASVEGLLSPLV